jgi:acyl transferase domain-containing protein/NADPH:quinone reductase-like Zn-dependent oxidoreductase/acyl carrier protein
MRKVAIVASAFRMPGTNPARFWDDLLAGRDLVTEVDPSRFTQGAYLHPNRNHPGSAYTFAAGSIGDVSGFDAGFFAISPREASLMDPQQRLLLELSWETFENAGIRPSSLRGSDCGVYIGIATVDYSWRLAEDLAAVEASFATGNTSSIAANRLSYIYDLRGPSMAIDTACSSSLVAFHVACRAIASGEISQALAGAVSLHLHPLVFISFSKAGMLSRQGRCRVFDASADGYVRSEGGGVFLLKDYDQAVADGNPILAVVAHSAVNTDGRKSGLTVPSAAAQSALLVNAYAQAGIEPWEIDYIEAHGTGTAVGDPVETRALGDALGKHRPKSEPLPIGSVKGNVGHLEAASGIAGLLKAVYCLKHRLIPAHVGMETPNPHIAFEDLNLEVVTANKPLPSSGRLVIGVNSFGFGGANAHVILESYGGEPNVPPALPKGSALPVVVSARDAEALKVAARELAEIIEGQPQSALYDLAYQSVFGRERHAHCAVLFGTTPGRIAKTLAEFSVAGSERGIIESGTALPEPVGAAFIYSGNGAQWAGMGRALLADPAFRGAVREVDKLFSRYADYSLEEELAGQNGADRYHLTEVAQPALFALQVGITVMLRRRGLVPVAVAGHSVGEVAAAWAAGSLSLAAAVSVIHHRSTLQGTTKGSGGMTAVNVGEARIREWLHDLGQSDLVSIAGVNSRQGVTVAGPIAQLERLEAALSRAQVIHKRLALDYAFHTPAMDALFAELRRALGHLEPEAAEIPFYSTVTGEQLTGKSLNAEYWCHNIRKPVLFESAIAGMVKQGINIFLEIGPHGVLRRYIQDCLADAGVTGRVMTTGMRGEDSPHNIYSGLSQALIAGASMQWTRLFPWRGRHVRLPNYPWRREAYWHAVTPTSLGLLERKHDHPLLGFRSPQAEFAWENNLDTLACPLLADHRVGGATIFPGSGYAELALAAAAKWQVAGVTEIEDLEIRAPLLLDAEPSRTLRFSLDPGDGHFVIRSREQMSDEAWTLHAGGRVLREATDIRLKRAFGLLPKRAPDFTAAGHTALTRAAGLDYGPAFQAVREGWIDGTIVVAALEMPPVVAEQIHQYHLHPALLDCAFQLIIHLLRDRAAELSELTFVPTRIGRMSYRGGWGAPCHARARLLNRGPHSLTVDVDLFDADGQPIALLEQVWFRAVRLQRTAVEHQRYFEYVAVPQPLPPLRDDAGAVETALPQLESALLACLSDAEVARAHLVFAGEVEPLLDELCSRFVSQVLPQLQALAAASAEARLPAAQLSLLPETQARSAQAPAAQSPPAPAQSRAAQFPPTRSPSTPSAAEQVPVTSAPTPSNHYADHLLAAARADGLLDEAHEILGSAHDIWNGLLADYPQHFGILQAVGRIGLHLWALLDGTRTLADIQPNPHALALMLREVQGTACQHRIELAVREQIGTALSCLPEGRRLGVVEISAGPPAFAAEVCRTLDFDRADYEFVSNDSSSLEEARRLQEKHPHCTVAALDTKGATSNCQLALLTLDGRSLEEALRALDYAAARLAPGGRLLVIGQHPAHWLDFIFGPDPAWWCTGQSGTTLPRPQPAQFWLERAAQAGFTGLKLLQPDIAANAISTGSSGSTTATSATSASTSTTSVTSANSAATSAGAYLLLGTRNPRAGDSVAPAEQPLPRHWLVLADETGYSAELALKVCEELEQAGDTVSRGSEVGTLSDAPAVIVEMRGLSRSVPANAAALLEQQVARCAAAAALIKTCDSAEHRAQCCFVTLNAATYLLPAPRAGSARGSALADAPLAGLARTLMNEAPACAVRLIDLESDSRIDVTAAALARELKFGESEQEIVLTASGQRYAPRLRIAEPPRITEPQRATQAPRTAEATRTAEPLRTAEPPRTATPAAAATASTTSATSAATDSTGAQEPLRLVFSQPGHLRHLQWAPQPHRALDSEGIEVAVRATGLNFRDVMYALGLLSDEAVVSGFAGASLGLEFAGVVSRVGPAVTGLTPGDPVVGFAPSSFGNRVVTQSAAVAHLPEGLSFEAAATIPSTFLTAFYALHHLARLQEGEKVLIHGATGGVGIAAIQVAKWCGAEIYATAGSDEKRDFLRLLGIEHVFDSRKLDFADQILELTGGTGVDVVLNSLAGEAINRNLQVLKRFGRFLELGKRDFYENTRVGLRPFRNNLSYFGIDADQLMVERPDLTQRLFKEVLALFASRVFQPLPFKTFDAAHVIDAFRHMQQARHIGKIVVTYRNGIKSTHAVPPAAAPRLAISAHGTILVTGGLSGFGLRTAEWLTERGARHLILVSRSGQAVDEAPTVLARLERRGVKVWTVACDVTDRPALERLLADAARDMPPLKGIVHCAMVIEDGLVRDSSAAQMRRVLAPKVLGALHLHELTRHLPLDFFVLYSSATTLFGNPGQGSYVAANFALEALARERRADGLPATCVRWGPIDDVGFLARNLKIKEALQSRMGGTALQSTAALDALEAMLVADRSDLGVLDLDWRALGRSLPSATAAKFIDLARGTGEEPGEDEGSMDVRRMLNELSEEQLRAAVIDLLKGEIGEILRLPADKIDAEQPLHQMGLDSLMGVELVVAVEGRFGVRLPVMALSESPTIAKLAGWIIKHLRGEEAVNEEADPDEFKMRAQVEKLAGQHAAEIAADEVDTIAAQLRTAAGASNQRMIH